MQIDGRITGRTKLLGLIGNPVEHTISPQLHNTISRELGLDMAYIPFRVEAASLGKAVEGLKALGFAGFNVTVPFKSDVIGLLDHVDKEALLIGAVNTIKITDGRLEGFNTDADGFAKSFEEEFGCGFKGARIAIIGAGGAARAITVKTAALGAEHISIINRTLSKARDIAELVRNELGVCSEALENTEDTAGQALRSADVIINTTTAGMHPDLGTMPVNFEIPFNSGQLVYDVVYNPVRTAFLEKAAGKGCKTANGLGMLFYQGIYAYELWTGSKLPAPLIQNVYELFARILCK